MEPLVAFCIRHTTNSPPTTVLEKSAHVGAQILVGVLGQAEHNIKTISDARVPDGR